MRQAARRRLFGRDLWLTLAVGSLAAVIAWVRLENRTRGVVWAEDGLFLEDRLGSAPLVALVDPYQGYLHVLPRAIVEVAVLLPIRDFAVAVTALCCVVVGAVAALVYVCSRDVLQLRTARVALALVTALVPTAAAEVLGNTANLHWLLLWLTPWVLLFRPASRGQGWVLGAVLLVVGLSEIQSVFFVPLLLVGLRQPFRAPMRVGLLAGLSAQLVVYLSTGRDAAAADTGTPSLADLVQGYGLHVVLQTWLPATGGVGDVLVEHGWSLVVLASLPFLVALALLVRGTRTGDDLVLTGTLLVGAVVPFVAGLTLNFRTFLAFSDLPVETLSHAAPLRYALVPSMFALAAVVVVADRWARRPGRLGVVLATGSLVGLAALGIVNVDPEPNTRSGYRGWAAEISAAERECRAGADRVAVDIAPATWVVEMTCTDITARSPMVAPSASMGS
ncbi:hypothetical protein [Nocardioides sp.]|uniref:hypothetical protein n=1 Tax=Nocardioides sp. TaxID=35761 RepID=UPI001A2032D9|nr:hypothetical protein [Nocardioides sp.]MBJ7359976.1 hypothetical protein [Nocardioides sp.]